MNEVDPKVSLYRPFFGKHQRLWYYCAHRVKYHISTDICRAESLGSNYDLNHTLNQLPCWLSVSDLLVIFSGAKHTVVTLRGAFQTSRLSQHGRENQLHLISRGGGFKEKDQESFALMDLLQFGDGHKLYLSSTSLINNLTQALKPCNLINVFSIISMSNPQYFKLHHNQN